MIRAAPTLVRLEAFRSVHAMVARFIKDERLRQAFSFHALLVGGNPFQASSVYALIHALEREWGVHFARGGTGALVKGMVRLIEDLGGEVRVNAPVERILTEGDRATGVVAGGREEAFDIVATNANVMHSYRDLLAITSAAATRRVGSPTSATACLSSSSISARAAPGPACSITRSCSALAIAN